MNILQSKINLVQARITQIENSDLFSPEQKEKLIKVNQIELDALEQESINNMDVINAQIL